MARIGRELALDVASGQLVNLIELFFAIGGQGRIDLLFLLAAELAELGAGSLPQFHRPKGRLHFIGHLGIDHGEFAQIGLRLELL